MKKYITDETTGLEYEPVSDCFFLAGDDKPENNCLFGMWGNDTCGISGSTENSTQNC